MNGFPILSVMLLVPAVAAAVCLFLDAKSARWLALAATLVNLALGIVLWASFDIGGAQWQFVEHSDALFGSFSWALGIDGFALLLPETPPEEAERVVQRIVGVLHQSEFHLTEEVMEVVRVWPSAGVAARAPGLLVVALQGRRDRPVGVDQVWVLRLVGWPG